MTGGRGALPEEDAVSASGSEHSDDSQLGGSITRCHDEEGGRRSPGDGRGALILQGRTPDSSDGELKDYRLKINTRERVRMHDLNSALDGLREVSDPSYLLFRFTLS